MKKKGLNLLLLLVLGLFLTTSCDDDSDGDGTPSLDRPSVGAATPNQVQVGTTVTLSIPIDAPGSIASITTTAGNGTIGADNAAALTGTTSGTYEVEYTAPASAGAGTDVVTVTVVDQQSPSKSEIESLTIAISEEPVKPLIVVSGGEENSTGTTTWTSDNIYLLDGYVFVGDGETLTIEPGTVVKGLPGQQALASALIVTRGGSINAAGTAAAPIIFTSSEDQIQNATEYVGNLGTEVGRWGGVIILGSASGNNASNGNQNVEGIPATIGLGVYGGTADDDNSGTLTYCSIRHGGTFLEGNNEINGLTLAGVGSGTTIDFVEVFANFDDAIEWFGGTVNAKHLIASVCGDDSFDYDDGYRGNNQFALVYQGAGVGNQGGEHDGGTSPEDGMPFATPKFYNATFVGSNNPDNDEENILNIRDNAGGEYHNSIFFNFVNGIAIENLASGEDSYARFQAGELRIENNIFASVGANDSTILSTVGDGSDQASLDDVRTYFGAAGNMVIADVISRTNLVPSEANATMGDLSTVPDMPAGFFETVSYKGAFDPAAASPWYTGWTAVENNLE